jgi:uncharacterized protein YlxP (DUF503 family)
VTVGVYTFELHLPQARSLKGKRRVVMRVKERIRSRFNAAVAEIGEHDGLWQRAGLIVVSVASDREALQRLFEAVRRDAELNTPGNLIATGTEFIDAADGGPAGWSEGWE